MSVVSPEGLRHEGSTETRGWGGWGAVKLISMLITPVQITCPYSMNFFFFFFNILSLDFLLCDFGRLWKITKNLLTSAPLSKTAWFLRGFPSGAPILPLLILSLLRANEEPHRALISPHYQPPDTSSNKVLD